MVSKMMNMKLLQNIYIGILVLVLLFCSSNIYSQSWVYFSGTVISTDSQLPMPDYPVFISLDDSLTNHLTLTNQNGYYYDSLFINPAIVSSAMVTVLDCMEFPQTVYFDNLDSLNIADFNICTNQSNCTANFTIVPDSANIYQIQFINLSEGNYSACSWEFGDGMTSEECNPIHQYNSTGTYEVCLTIEDSLSMCYDTFCFLLSIGESSCQADFNWTADVENNMQINFTDASIGNINNWIWDFGDMNYAEEPSPTHFYEAEGQYYVTLTIFDSLEYCFDVISKWVYVTDSSSCVSDFQFVLDTLNNSPNTYYFTDISQGNPQNWLWNFGDGQVSLEQNPIHVYEQEGSYEVCLTISSDNGTNNCFDVNCKTIETLDYYSFGGQVFIGDYPMNIEEDDSANIAIAYLYRRFMNKWELMDTREFWKFGYYWFTDKPTGDYIIRTDLLPGSISYGDYIPVYHNNTTTWTEADIFSLENDEQFAINISMKKITEMQSGIGQISGYLEVSSGCNENLTMDSELVYLLNSVYQIVGYTYTNELGEFVFDGLGFGSYFVQVEVTGKMSSTIGLQLDESSPIAGGVGIPIECNGYVATKEYNFENKKIVLNVFPQPASNFINVELNTSLFALVNIDLLTIEGRKVFSVTDYQVVGNKILKINTQQFNPGIYLLKVIDISSQEFETKKIIIN